MPYIVCSTAADRCSGELAQIGFWRSGARHESRSVSYRNRGNIARRVETGFRPWCTPPALGVNQGLTTGPGGGRTVLTHEARFRGRREKEKFDFFTLKIVTVDVVHFTHEIFNVLYAEGFSNYYYCCYRHRLYCKYRSITVSVCEFGNECPSRAMSIVFFFFFYNVASIISCTPSEPNSGWMLVVWIACT